MLITVETPFHFSSGQGFPEIKPGTHCHLNRFGGSKFGFAGKAQLIGGRLIFVYVKEMPLASHHNAVPTRCIWRQPDVGIKGASRANSYFSTMIRLAPRIHRFDSKRTGGRHTQPAIGPFAHVALEMNGIAGLIN